MTTQREVETDQAADVRRRSGRWLVVVGGLLVVGFVAYWSGLAMQVAIRLFGPPRVVMREAYTASNDSGHFDHSTFDQLLKQIVDQDGWVDYKSLQHDPSPLDRYIKELGNAAFESLGRDEKLALLINAYNAFTLRLILDHYPIASIMDIPANRRWKDRRWHVGQHVWNLNEIENEQIRPKFIEPRVHFALVCASTGCPRLRPEAYTADRLDHQLDEQARFLNTDARWVRFDPQNNTVDLTSLYRWYPGDFEQAAGTILAFVARYNPALRATLDAGRTPQIRWLEYDWSLNETR